MKKKILFLIIIGFCLIFFTGCKKKTGTASSYKIIYQDYVGVCEVTAKDNVIEAIDFDEYFLPHVWSKVIIEDQEDLENELISVNGSYYSKYINIDEMIFQAEVRTGGITIDGINYPNQIIKYTSQEIDDLYLHLKNSETTCQWYVESVKNQKTFICNASGDKLTKYSLANTLGYSKQEGKYWSKDNFPLGWIGNIEALTQSLIGEKIKTLTLKEYQEDAKTYWSVGEIKTGATLVAAQEYYDLILSAYNKIKKN